MLRDKLLDKGHDEEAADYALAWLAERSLLDDAAYAESVVRSCARKGYGAMRIRQELTAAAWTARRPRRRCRAFRPTGRSCAPCWTSACAGMCPTGRRSTRRSRSYSGAGFLGGYPRRAGRVRAQPA